MSVPMTARNPTSPAGGTKSLRLPWGRSLRPRLWSAHVLLPPAALAVCLAWLVLLPGCGRPKLSNRPVRPDDVRRFETLYSVHCSGCHGSDGAYGPAPPLNDALLLAIYTDEQLRNTINSGRHGYLMPAFAKAAGGKLVPDQVTVLVEGMRSRWAREELRGSLPAWIPASSGGQPPARSGDAGAGRQTYTALCTSCHGDAAQGDQSAPNSQTFLALISNQTLRRLLITGRPDLGMPNYAGMKDHWKKATPLDQSDVDNLLAYLASCRDNAAEGSHGAR
jgi:cytochrome c oxidase cbb3-type subunit 3